MKRLITIFVDTERELIFTNADIEELYEDFEQNGNWEDFETWAEEGMGIDLFNASDDEYEELLEEYDEDTQEAFEDYIEDTFISKEIAIEI